MGAVPTAYIFGRILKGIDIRKFGSGNSGATNAMRVLGKWPGIVVLILDIFKGLAAAVFLPDFFSVHITGFTGIYLRLLLGVVCICGHNWTVFLQFKGGKGVATSLGVFLGLALKVNGFGLILGLVVLTWVLVFAFSRIISLGSIISACSLPIYMLIFRKRVADFAPLMGISVLLTALILFKHRSNLKRLIQGKESRIF